MERKLAAIFAADVVGYSSIMAKDEEGTVARVTALCGELITHRVTARGGRVFKTMGDGVMAEFASAVEAVRAAFEIQEQLAEQNNRLPVDLRLQLRIGVNLGDVVVEGADLFGDGVNVAARLEQAAPSGGVAISAGVHEQVYGRVDADFRDAGYRQFKNIDRQIHVYMTEAVGAETTPAPGDGLFDFSLAEPRPVGFTGGCLCGAVRYASREPPLGTGYCHCRFCQKFTGAPVGVWTAFAGEALKFTRGAPKVFASSPIAERGFCAECGTSLTYRLLQPQDAGYVVVYAGTLDDPGQVAPTSHGGVESRMPWFDTQDDLGRTRCDESWTLRMAWGAVGREDPSLWAPDVGDEGER